MIHTPTPGAAAELPVVAWSGIDGRWLRQERSAVSRIALTPHAPAQAQLDALREEVARLTRELVDAMAEHDDVRAELAALKAQPTDVDALMELADEWTTLERRYERGNVSSEACDTAREALRAKLAARKEEL